MLPLHPQMEMPSHMYVWSGHALALVLQYVSVAGKLNQRGPSGHYFVGSRSLSYRVPDDGERCQSPGELLCEGL